MSSAPVIELDRVTRLYGSFAALRQVTLSVAAGESVMLLGENGAGKSTLLRLIAGLTTPTYGSVTVFGETPRDVRHRLAYMSHAPMLYDEMTALENLHYFATLYASAQGTAAAALDPATALREVGLDPALPRRISEYSQGMRQRVSLARVLMTSPDLLLLDEPFANLDVAGAKAMVERLGRYLHDGAASISGQTRSLVLTTHQRDLAEPVASRIITLERGRLMEQACAADNTG